MSLFSQADAAFVSAVADMVHCNPFLPERIEMECAALGADFDRTAADWNVHPEVPRDHPNLSRIRGRAENLMQQAWHSMRSAGECSKHEAVLYEELAVFVLYHKCREELSALIESGAGAARSFRAVFETYQEHAVRWLGGPVGVCLPESELVHLFACFYQVRRAFHHIFRYIIGVSPAAARFRAAVWQSLFTHDMRRYRRALFDRMGDFTTLITGPSGTGKELAARAIALSRYVPFDAQKKSFLATPDNMFVAVNLSALSPTLIESELFGHRRGSFTGAMEDRAGWLETCPGPGTVFIDEVGDLDPGIQLKLLRVLQERTFQRIGDRAVRHFSGKIIAATNRDLAQRSQRGAFREDFYYRLCADQIRAPSLAERIAERGEELPHLVRYIAARIVGEQEAAALVDQVLQFVSAAIPANYDWPGNVRELEQCVRNILIRREYRPVHAPAPDEFLALMRAGNATADEVLRQYCISVYKQTGSYLEASRRLGLDRRTVRAWVKRDHGAGADEA